jgi:transcriptional regulator with XRE-family HTH domain
VDKKIGARIRARRLAIAMSQEALAHKLGVSFQQVQKYEKGVNRVAASTLLDLAEALDVSIAALLPSGRAGEAEPSMIEDADVALLVRLLKDLDAERRRALIKVARALAREPKLAPAGRRRRD